MKVYIYNKFYEHILDGFKVKDRTQFLSEKNSRDSALQKVATVLFCAHHLMMLYICIKLYEIIFDNFQIIERTRF